MPEICVAEQYVSIVITFHAITFRNREVSASQTGANTEFEEK